jgi:PilZ domain
MALGCAMPDLGRAEPGAFPTADRTNRELKRCLASAATFEDVTGLPVRWCADPVGEAAMDVKERRGSPRRRVLKGAIIAYGDRKMTLPCTVRNLSATGARVRIEVAVSAPDNFILFIEMDGIEVDCEVVNRSGTDLGVKFISPTRPVKPKRQIVRGIR